ncbi:MAG: hypothetical protein JF606_15250 [Burkholderiales bacterium]|jgi:hypothetical protein|nr:hypothetical protein [Burkholderiales bacterium]
MSAVADVEWNREDSNAASAEGWDLIDAGGLLQVQHVDEADVLVDDAAAWYIILAGTLPHHEKVRSILRKTAPIEWEHMLQYADNKCIDVALSRAELDALLAFRSLHGRAWKSALWRCWERSTYPMLANTHAASLQLLRNTRGPEWLKRVSSRELFGS